MINKPLIKNILSAAAVAVFGYLLLVIAFVFKYLLQSAVTFVLNLFNPVDPEISYGWYPAVLHALFLVIIGLISWFILRSKLGVLYKAIYLTVPFGVVFVTIGMYFYHWPAAVFSLGGLFAAGVLYYLYRTRQPWLYYYALILVGLTLAIFTLLGGEI